MPDIKKPNFEAQHYTFMAVYDEDQATRGVYWPFSLLAAGTSLGLAITPAVDMPDKWFLPVATRQPGCVIVPGRMQKGDGFEMFDLRTEGQSEDAYRRLRIMAWMMRAIANNHEDYDTYLRVSNGYVPADVPDIWVPTPDGNFAIYDPSQEDLPENVSDGATDENARGSDGEGHWVDDPLPPISAQNIRPPSSKHGGFAAIL